MVNLISGSKRGYPSASTEFSRCNLHPLDSAWNIPGVFIAIFYKITNSAQFEKWNRIKGANMRRGRALHVFAYRIEPHWSVRFQYPRVPYIVAP